MVHLLVSECCNLSLGWYVFVITHSRFGDSAPRFSVQVQALSLQQQQQQDLFEL